MMIRYLVLLVPLLCSCKPNAQQHFDEIKYQQKKTAFTQEDNSSPMGYWEVHIEHPEFTGTNVAVKKINAAITTISTEFQCDNNKGDKQFIAEVTLLNTKIISLKYTDSWYCVGMPQPEGRSGGMTFNLATGSLITFDNEIKRSTANHLTTQVTAGLEKALIEKEVNDECPTPTISYVYLTEENIVFVNSSNDETTIQCEVDYKISRNNIKKYLKPESLFN